MKTAFLKYLLFAAAFGFISRIVPAQTLPQLPMDSRISQGTLGCGASYYMVVNPSEKGFTDISIVQKDTLTLAKTRALDVALLSRMGILPAREGFLTEREGCTYYRFQRVPSYRTEALDSTLLFTFAQMAFSREPQAVVVSGDIDPTELKKKMDIFSMMVPRLKYSSPENNYVWTPVEAPEVYLLEGEEASVEARYSSARIPRDQMNTAQFLVTDLFSREFGLVLQHRLEANLSDAGIPYSAIRFHRLGSADTFGDEQYVIRVLTCRDSLPSAGRVLSRTLAELGTYGVSVKEFADAKTILTGSSLRKAAATPSRREDSDRCIAHFLHGASLAPVSEEVRLLTRKNVSDNVETSLFNDFSSALVQQLRNLTLTYTQAPDSLDSMDALFQYNLAYLQGWVSPSFKDYLWHGADTAGFRVSASRVKLQSERTESVTGGTLWTFSNGMRVAYKHLPGSGLFHYALQLDGGLSRIPDLREGEGGYIPDVLFLCNTGGYFSGDWQDVLAANAVSMEADADLYNFYLKGSAPSGKLTLLLKALATLSKERSLNQPRAKAYLQRARLHVPTPEERMERLLNPDYAYTSSRNGAVLSSETLVKANHFFRESFSRTNEGILVLAGDLDPGVVKKMLLKYLGAFPTGRAQVRPRRQVPFRTLSGTLTHTEEGTGHGLYVLMDADVPLTAVNYAGAFMAAEALKVSLAEHLDARAFSARVEPSFITHPEERLRMLVRCEPVPGSAEEANPQTVLPALRLALQEAASRPIASTHLRAWKQLVNSKLQFAQSSPEEVVAILLSRYAAGKDLVSNYKENIQSVQADKVSGMLQALYGGGRIELIDP